MEGNQFFRADVQDGQGVIQRHSNAGTHYTTAMLESLVDILRRFEGDRSVNVVRLRMTGMVNPCSYQPALADASEAQAVSFARMGQAVVRHIRGMKKAVIAEIDGDCTGAVFELALASDIIIATGSSRFGFCECAYGMVPGFGGTQLAARKVYESFVKFLVLTGELVSAEELYQKGILNRIYDNEAELLAAGDKLAARQGTELGKAKRIAHDSPWRSGDIRSMADVTASVWRVNATVRRFWCKVTWS